MGVVQRESCRMKQHAKVTVVVGDWVKSIDHRDEFYRRVGQVTEITEWVDSSGFGRGACVRVRYFGPSVMGERGGSNSTGAQWYEFFGPASEDGYAWKGPWRATRRDGAKAAKGDTGECWSCGRKASWLQRHGTGHTTFACSKHADVEGYDVKLAAGGHEGEPAGTCTECGREVRRDTPDSPAHDVESGSIYCHHSGARHVVT